MYAKRLFLHRNRMSDSVTMRLRYWASAQFSAVVMCDRVVRQEETSIAIESKSFAAGVLSEDSVASRIADG